MSCFYSSNNGVLSVTVNQALTGSSVDTATTAAPTFTPENYDYMILYFSGANEGNYGQVWNYPRIPGDQFYGFHSSINMPTGALTGGGTILSFPIDLRYNNSAYGTGESVSHWYYSGYSATGICNVRAYLDGGVPRAEFINTHYGDGVSAYSSIRTIGGGDYTTSGPYYWDISGHTTNAASAENVQLGLIFSAVKNAYSYDEILPLRSLP